MAKICNPLLLLLFYLKIINTSSDHVFPDLYHISYISSYYPNLVGYYKKQEYQHKEKPVFKKPGQDNYCLYFNDDGKWTLGVKVTRGDVYDDRLSMKDADHDLPTSGHWIVQAALGQSAQVDVTIATYSPEYPDYYEVHIPKATYLDGFYKRLPENQNYESFPVFKKRADNNGKENFLFLHSEGDWRFGLGTSAFGFASSSQKGLPMPELSNGWKIWSNGDWRMDSDFKLLPLNPVYPASYTVNYNGEDQEITEKLQSVLGIYEKQTNIKNGVPLYKNHDFKSSIFLGSSEKWVIENNDYSYASLFQESYGSPILLQDTPWKLSKTRQAIANFYVRPNDKQIQRNPKKLPENKKQNETTEINTEATETEFKSETTSNGLIWGITISAVVLVVFLIVFAVVLRKRSRNAKDEEPKIDENMYYGVDYDDIDADNAITDNNDYYD